MGKKIEIDGEYYRYRRGKLVKIPKEWVDQVIHDQIKKKRQSKYTKKMKRRLQAQRKCRAHDYLDRKYGLDEDVDSIIGSY